MLIGVISDTHQGQPEAEWVERVQAAFAGVEMVLHAGDLTSLAVIEALWPLEVLAVAGNMDGYLVSQGLPRKRVVEAEGRRIGLIHGWGSPDGVEERVAGEFSGVDAIVFGHSHRPTNLVRGGVLFFNPGSAGVDWRSSNTVGILTVDAGITGRIIELAPPRRG